MISKNARIWPVVLLAMLIGSFTGSTAQAQTPRKPNIIFILTDDLGYGDLGVFFQNQRRADGKPAHATPHLDALAAGGMKLTHHYCPAPVCAPSRASLLLGVHQGHANVRDNQFDKALEANHTLATVLKQAGYATAAIGKWGLQGKPTTQPPDWPAHPLNRGFDYYYGYMRHVDGHEHYPKEGVHRGKKEVWENRTEVSAGLDKCYTTDLFTARAKQWIIDQQKDNAGQPYFLYLAFDTPHAVCALPTQAYPEGGGLTGGLKWTGKAGEMINTASGKVDSWIHPDYAATNWPDVYKRYATSVRRIDDAVGDLKQLLKDTGAAENTMIVFTSDNGPSVESYLPEKYSPVFFHSFGPFDGIKRDLWEGGLRVPTIAHWPGRIVGGATSIVPSSFPDWMATFADAAGVSTPARCDGVSLLPSLTGKGTQLPTRVYVEYFQNGKSPDFGVFEASHRNRQRRQMQMLRLGNYVGVRYDVKGAGDDFEIYDAVNDPKQIKNLAGDPGSAELRRQFNETALRVRRPDAEAVRPYDGALVPAVEGAAGAKPGLRRRSYAGSFPWVPQFESLTPTQTGEVAQVDGAALSKGAGGEWLDGYLTVPADGRYVFTLSTDGRAVMRVHEATVIDADYGYQAGAEVTAVVMLKAGKHPIRLACIRRANADAAPALKLMWSGPGFEKQAIPAAAWSYGVPAD